MQHSFFASLRHVRLRPLAETDIESLRIWRNDKALCQFLTPMDPITPQKQKQWFLSYLEDPSILVFAIEETQILKRLVGSLALYRFEEHTAGIGKITIGDKEAHGKQIGYYSFLIAMHIGFTELGLQGIKSEVHEKNTPSLINEQKVGFKEVGRHAFWGGGYELDMYIEKEQFEEKNHMLLKEIQIERGE